MASRSSLLSGQYSRSCIGDLGNDFIETNYGMGELEPEMPESQRGYVFPNKTLPEILKGAGYCNTAIGKWHIRPSPNILGFDKSIIPLNNHRHSGQKYSFDGGSYCEQNGFGPEFELQQVEEYLERQKTNQPFFLYYNVMPPHMPLADMPEQFLSLYNSEEICLRSNVCIKNELPFSEEWFKIYLWDYLYYHYQQPATKTLPHRFDVKKLVALYYGAISWIDSIFGRLLTSIANNNLEENTIVLFTSDHGDQLGSHHRWNKGVVYEESIRIPQIWRWPKTIRCGQSLNQLTSSIDVMPSLLEACGIDVPDWVQGKSIFKILNGDMETRENNQVFIETSSSSKGDQFSELGIRTSDQIFSLCLNRESHELVDGFHSLYNLIDDPYQENDLCKTGCETKLVEQMRDTLESWHKETPWLKAPKGGTNRTNRFDSSGFYME